METPAEESVNNVHSEDFSYLCRACLSRNSSTSLKDEPWLLCIFKSILGLANIDINLENNLPTEICDGCLQKLEQISAFISLIRFSDKNLHQALINKECLEKKTHGVVEAVKKKSDDFGCNLKRSTINPKLEKNVFEGNIQISGKDNDETMPESEPHTKGSELKTNVEEIDEYWDSPEFVSCSQEIIQSNELSSHSIKSECKVEDDIEITKTEIQPAYETCKDAIERNSEGCNSINDCSERSLEMRRCEFCKETFIDVNIWKTHMELHSEEMLLSERDFVKLNVKTESQHVEGDASSETFSCENTEESELCEKAFPVEFVSEKHVRVRSKGNFKCDICSREFSISANLKRHMIVHTKEKPFKCDICLKRYTTKVSLETHTEVHYGSIRCKICSKEFSSNNSLLKHKRFIHTGKNLLTCDICQKKFLSPSKLKIHMAVHTGEKFKCLICSQLFSQSSNLKKHMKIVHSGIRYPCDICKKSYTERCRLKRHLSTHNEPPQEFDVEIKLHSDIFINDNDVKMENK